MIPLTVSLARHLDLKKRRSTVPLVLRPLGEMRKAAVFLPSADCRTASVVKEIRDFFGAAGIQVAVYAFNLEWKQDFDGSLMPAVFFRKRHLNWYGRVSRGRRTPAISGDEDLFISLAPARFFAIDREAVCSRASVKVGMGSEDIYNITLCGSPEELSDQGAVFHKIIELLEKIR